MSFHYICEFMCLVFIRIYVLGGLNFELIQVCYLGTRIELTSPLNFIVGLNVTQDIAFFSIHNNSTVLEFVLLIFVCLIMKKKCSK